MKLKMSTLLLTLVFANLSYGDPCSFDLNQGESIEKLFFTHERSGSLFMKLSIHTSEKTVAIEFPFYGSNANDRASMQGLHFLNNCRKLAQLHRQGLVSGTLGYAFGNCNETNGNYLGIMRYSYTVSGHKSSGISHDS